MKKYVFVCKAKPQKIKVNPTIIIIYSASIAEALNKLNPDEKSRVIEIKEA